MLTSLFCFLIFTFASLGATASSLHQESSSNTVLDYLVYSNHNAPYQFSDVVSGHKGIVCAIVDEIAIAADMKVHPHMEPIKRLKRSISSNRYRHWVTYGMRVWEDDPLWQQHHFSELDLFLFKPAVIQRADSAQPVKSLLDIGTKKVLLILGFDYGAVEKLLIRRGAKIQWVANQTKALNMLRQGRADVFLEDELRARFNLADMNLSPEEFRFEPLSPIDESVTRVALVMSADMPDAVVATMNRVLKQMQDSGRLQQIVSQYNHGDPRQVSPQLESHSAKSGL